MYMCCSIVKRANLTQTVALVFVGCLFLILCNILLFLDLTPTYVPRNYLILEQLVDESQCPACFGYNLSCQFFNVDEYIRGHIYLGHYNGIRAVAKKPKASDYPQNCKHVNSLIDQLGISSTCNNRSLFHELQLLRNKDEQFVTKLVKSVNRCESKRLYSNLTSVDIYTFFFDYALFITSRAHHLGISENVPICEARCPQVSVYRNMGTALSRFLKSSILSRYRLCYEALILAERMSMTSNGYIIYMTDISLDNLVWTGDGRVMLVDLDGVYVIDSKQALQGTAITDDKYYNHKFDDCINDCVKFVPSDFCTYSDGGDFNYYSICKFVINKLIFYDADEELMDFLEGCVKDVAGREREKSAKQLKQALLHRLTRAAGIPIEMNFVTSEEDSIEF